VNRPRAAALLALAALAAASACSRRDDEARRRLLAPGAPAARAAAPASLDFSRPLDALLQDADDAATRLGSFEWSASVDWTVERLGEDARRVRAVEHHRLRQTATGDFQVDVDLDPGLGPGSETGRQIVLAGGRTWARAEYAPWRERPTDHGRDARRFRAESFSLPRAVVALYGDALAASPAGEANVLGRAARRFRLSLAKGAPAPAPTARPAGAPAPDEDTARRLRFLDGRVPLAADGELVLDAATGAALKLRLAGAFGVKDDPQARATVELLAQMKALGADVAPVAAPKGALPDERKPAGVANALDAAGLRKRGEEKPARDEPADEPSD
jgi:hypothetical protein